MLQRSLSGVLVAVCLAVAACGSTPAAPAPVVVVQPAPAPTPIPSASFTYGSGTLFCQTGFCASFTMALTNTGPGCATNMQVSVFWYGADGAIPLPNTPSIPMGYAGGLSNVIFRPGTTIVLSSLGGFNDVRSAHTVYAPVGTFTNIRC